MDGQLLPGCREVIADGKESRVVQLNITDRSFVRIGTLGHTCILWFETLFWFTLIVFGAIIFVVVYIDGTGTTVTNGPIVHPQWWVWRVTMEWYWQGKPNPTLNDPGANSGLRGGRPATNCLSHYTAMRPSSLRLLYGHWFQLEWQVSHCQLLSAK